MKSENMKYLLLCYMREKEFFPHDALDGVHVKDIHTDSHSAPLPVLQCSGMREPMEIDCAPIYPTLAGEAPLAGVDIDTDVVAVARHIARQLSEMSDEFEAERSRGSRSRAASFGNSVLEFQEHCLFVGAGSGEISIPVVRSGNTRNAVNIAWKTNNKSAIGGVHYVAAEGIVTFAPNENTKSIQLHVLENEDSKDRRFTVELLNADGSDIGANHQLTIHLSDHSNFQDDEKQTIENILNCGSTSVASVATCLSDLVTSNTFLAALQFVTSSATSLPAEMTLAFELWRVTFQRERRESLADIVCQFFRQLPEMEEIAPYFNRS